jgi:NAD(P)-dependent dehydrogenase (short-subunit alcohol dehydrogenase family)
LHLRWDAQNRHKCHDFEGEMMRLAGKIAIVTGGGHGMGAAESRLFALEGAGVVVADIDMSAAVSVADEIAGGGGDSIAVECDVTSDQSWEMVTSATTSRFGGVDVLVNNAGISGLSGADPFDIETFHRLMNTHALGAFLGTKHVVPIMIDRGGGSIVNIASIAAVAAFAANAGHMAYGPSKAAVQALSRGTAVRYGAHGIRANTILPGIMPPMQTTMAKHFDEAQRAAMLAAIPLRRSGKVDEVARLALFLASDEASYITGADIAIDGGILAT